MLKFLLVATLLTLTPSNATDTKLVPKPGSVVSGGGGSGTVTSVAMSVPSFLSVSGSPVTTTGTFAVSLSGTALPIANGGTGQTSAANAINALLPTQTGNAGEFLTTDGSVASWAAAGGGADPSLLNDGSAAAPAYAFTSDTDTGVYRSAANQLSFSTTGIQRVFINSSGNIVPGANNAYSVGDIGAVYFSIMAADILQAIGGFRAYSGGGAANMAVFRDGVTAPSGVTMVGLRRNAGAGTQAIGISGGDDVSSGSALGPVLIEGQNNTGAGAGGDVRLRAGTGATNGKIKLNTGTAPTVGYVWTATNADGSGEWAAAAGGAGAIALETIAAVLGQATISFNAVADSGSFDLDWNASGSPVTINFNDSDATIQTQIQALTGLSTITSSGDVSTGISIVFTGAIYTAPLAAFTISNNTLFDVATPVVITPAITVEPDQNFTLTSGDFGKLVIIDTGPVAIDTPTPAGNEGEYFYFRSKTAFSTTINNLVADISPNCGGHYVSDGSNYLEVSKRCP